MHLFFVVVKFKFLYNLSDWLAEDKLPIDLLWQLRC